MKTTDNTTLIIDGISTRGAAINRSCEVVGTEIKVPGSLGRAIRYDANGLAEIAGLGGDSAGAYAINDAGVIAGHSRFQTGNNEYRAFRSVPNGNAGLIVGSSQTSPASTASVAFLYTGTPGSGQMVSLGTLGGTWSNASSINERGDIVGSASRADSGLDQFAMLYVGTPGAGGQMIDLDAWLDAVDLILGANWVLTSARDINAAGLITGSGIYEDGPGGLPDGTRAFILDASSLTGVPEPSSVGSLVAAGFLLLRRRRATSRA